MKSPEHDPIQSVDKPENPQNLSPEDLDAMSPSQLADALERALDDMTEETYDEEVIQRYLDALEQKMPVPPHPGAEQAYDDLARTVKTFRTDSPGEDRKKGRRLRLRKVLRWSLTAALITVCLLGGMMMVQAAGWDLFGAMARWTGDVFSFVEIGGQETSAVQPPEEWEEMRTILEAEGQTLYFPQIPDGFELIYSDFYVGSANGEADLLLGYEKEDTFIGFQAIHYYNRLPVALHEKDETQVETFELNGITYYVFSNNGTTKVVWLSDSLEYSIWTDDKSLDVTELIQTV